MTYTEEVTSGSSHVALVTLADYMRFLTDDGGRLRKNLFDLNVRDYQGDVEVNREIRASWSTPRVPTSGESPADYINATLGFGLTGTTVTFSLALLGALAVQFRTRRYVPWVYWLVVVLISVVGTLLTDILTDNEALHWR